MDEEKNKEIVPPEIPEDEVSAGEIVPPEVPEDEVSAGEVVPPEIPEEIRTEKKWADTFGMEYDEQKVMEQNAPLEADTYPGVDQQGAAPMYVMPPEEQLPPVVPEMREPMPPTYMLWAVLTTLCCCLPVGVVAIFFAAQVSTRYYARDFAGSRKASERAELWIILAIVLGMIANILYLPFSLLSGSFI